MVVKVSVIGTLGLHELCGVSQCAPAGGNLSLEEFQLPAAPLDTVPAAVLPHVAALRQGIAHLAEPEGLGKRNDLALPLVHPYSHGLKPSHHLPGQLLQRLDVRQNDIVIVHVVAGHMDARPGT